MVVAAGVSAVRAQEGVVALPEVVVSASPVPGTPGISEKKVPAFVTTVPARDFEERRSPSVADTITSHVPGAIAINVDGNDVSPDHFYRGFDASRRRASPTAWPCTRTACASTRPSATASTST